MKTHLVLRTLALGLTLTWAASLLAAEDYVRYKTKPGSKVLIEGSSNIHDWTVESGLIGGTLDIDSGFPLDPSKAANPGKVDAKVSTFIMVSSIRSGKKAMDNVMYDTMKKDNNPKISYALQELVFKKAAADEGQLHFDATGTLTVAGLTVTNTMPVILQPQADDKMLVKGTTMLKMTDFGMKPPAPAVGLGLIKTDDEVKVSFEWVTAKEK